MSEIEYKKQDMILAMRNSNCMVSNSCEIAKCSRNDHYEWMREDADYKAAIDNLKQRKTDMVEEKLMELIEGVTVQEMTAQSPVIYERPPCKSSIQFYLKTKAKSRGYADRLELTGKKGSNLVSFVLPVNDKGESMI